MDLQQLPEAGVRRVQVSEEVVGLPQSGVWVGDACLQSFKFS